MPALLGVIKLYSVTGVVMGTGMFFMPDEPGKHERIIKFKTTRSGMPKQATAKLPAMTEELPIPIIPSATFMKAGTEVNFSFMVEGPPITDPVKLIIP